MNRSHLVRIGCILLLLLSLTLVLVTGCQKSDRSAAKETVTIRYLNFESLPEQQKMIREIISKFEKKHPGIKVKYDFSPSPDKVLVEIAGGTAPDVFYGGNWNAPMLALKGAVENLMPFVEEDGVVLEDYFKITVDTFAYDGKLYCFPLHFSTTALFYNKDIFDKASVAYPDETWTWQDFLAAAKRLTKDTNGDGRVDQYGTVGSMWPLWILENGGAVFNKDETRCLLSRRESVEAVQFFLDLYHKHRVTPGLELGKDRELSNMFMTGKIGMFLSATAYTTAFQNIKGFDWGLAPIPMGKKRISGLAVGGLYIPQQSKHKKEAWEFVKFYCGEEGQKILGRAKNCVPAHRETANTVFAVAPYQSLGVFVDAVQYAQTPYKSHKILQVLEEVIQPRMDELFISGKGAPRKLKEIESAANSRLNR